MKILIALCLVIFCLSFSEQKGKYVNCPEDHSLLSDAKIRDGCFLVMCMRKEFGGDAIRKCHDVMCQAGTQIGYNEPDNFKTFPDCCGGPICKE